MSDIVREHASPVTLSDAELEACGRAAIEANRSYCLATGEDPPPPWELLGQSTRDGVLKGVRMALEGQPPSASHENWIETRTREGWTYGPVLDRANKVHPNLVPYDQLPAVQRVKDAMFQGVVRVVAQAFQSGR